MKGEIAVNGDREEGHEVGHSREEEVVIPLGSFRVRGSESGLDTVEVRVGSQSENGLDDKVDREMRDGLTVRNGVRQRGW